MGISLNKTSVGTTIKEYVLMALGMFLYSFGWICCILPANAAGGGATGLSLLSTTLQTEQFLSVQWYLLSTPYSSLLQDLSLVGTSV